MPASPERSRIQFISERGWQTGREILILSANPAGPDGQGRQSCPISVSSVIGKKWLFITSADEQKSPLFLSRENLWKVFWIFTAAAGLMGELGTRRVPLFQDCSPRRRVPLTFRFRIQQPISKFPRHNVHLLEAAGSLDPHFDFEREIVLRLLPAAAGKTVPKESGKNCSPFPSLLSGLTLFLEQRQRREKKSTN